jgi:hypothetical protein
VCWIPHPWRQVSFCCPSVALELSLNCLLPPHRQTRALVERGRPALGWRTAAPVGAPVPRRHPCRRRPRHAELHAWKQSALCLFVGPDASTCDRPSSPENTSHSTALGAVTTPCSGSRRGRPPRVPMTSPSSPTPPQFFPRPRTPRSRDDSVVFVRCALGCPERSGTGRWSVARTVQPLRRTTTLSPATEHRHGRRTK